jgi:signal peptide peptidase SppA
MHNLIDWDSTKPVALLERPGVREFFKNEIIGHLEGNKAFFGSFERDKRFDTYLIDQDGKRVELASLDAAAGNVKPSGGMLAVVPLMGPLTSQGTWRGTSLNEFVRTIKMLDANSAVSSILIQITSPGGTVTGTPEAADAVRAIRAAGNTRIVAIADGMMASAATWIGTAAEKVFVTPSGEAGSIGVISMYTDFSKAYEEMGVKIDVMRTPALKARFTGVEPLTDEMRATMQVGLDKSYESFKRAMADNRGVRVDSVESKFGGGEMLDAQEAKEAGLVDGIATVDETIAWMTAKTTRQAPRSHRAALALAELD